MLENLPCIEAEESQSQHTSHANVSSNDEREEFVDLDTREQSRQVSLTITMPLQDI